MLHAQGVMDQQLESKRSNALERRRGPLQGRVALVTGGARGIGRGIAVELLRAGAVVIIGDLAEDEMRETCQELASRGSIDWVKLDVSDHASMHAGVEEIRSKHGSVDVLVNNAGVAKPGLFAEEAPRGISKAIAVDLAGAICLTRIVLPDMIAKEWGRVVNISSMMAFTGSPGFAVYSAAKSGILGFSEAIERELRTYPQIRVTAVLPPSVRTHAFEAAQTDAPGLMRWKLIPPISVAQVARRTVHGLIAGRKRVYCSAESYMVSLTERLLPWLMDRILMFMFQPPARRLAAKKHSPPRLPATPATP